jgi:hypothetical protein
MIAGALSGGAYWLAPTTAAAAKPCVIPRAWGKLVTVAPRVQGAELLVFEAENGTIRITNTDPNYCGNKTISPEIERQ